jgi:SAM-dependent methyltransferase
MSQPQREEYVLGTGADELSRLAVQHRLWSDAATAAWKSAGLQPGHRVLDVGSGPGFAAFDLAQMVTSSGAVVAIDESANFIQHVNDQAKARGLPSLVGRVGDVQKLREVLGSEALFDLAYARWVLCFVPDPAAVVQGVAASLRRGGAFVVHDYFNYGAMTMAPRSESHDRAVQATIRSWRDKGGDPDVVGRLPQLLVTNGFRIESMVPHNRIARGSDAMFTWVDTWWRTFAPKLVGMGLLSAFDCEQLFADLREIQRSATGFVQSPVVYELVARKL